MTCKPQALADAPPTPAPAGQVGGSTIGNSADSPECWTSGCSFLLIRKCMWCLDIAVVLSAKPRRRHQKPSRHLATSESPGTWETRSFLGEPVEFEKFVNSDCRLVRNPKQMRLQRLHQRLCRSASELLLLAFLPSNFLREPRLSI